MASDGYGPIRVSYSILNSWARGDIDRAVAPYAGVEIEATEAMEYGKKKHEAWEKETRRTGRLPARFGGRKLKSPQLELNTKKVRKLNDWCYLSGVLDVLDGDTAIDYKTGRMSASEYLNSKQHECYQILYPNIKRFEYHCCNQHLQRKDDGYITVAIAYLDKNTLKNGIEWVLTMAAELREYLINNGMGDKLDQGKGFEK